MREKERRRGGQNGEGATCSAMIDFKRERVRGKTEEERGRVRSGEKEKEEEEERSASTEERGE